jgi:hypothetical protein
VVLGQHAPIRPKPLMPTVGTFEELATGTGTGTARRISRTLRGVIERATRRQTGSLTVERDNGRGNRESSEGHLPGCHPITSRRVHSLCTRTVHFAGGPWHGPYVDGCSHPWKRAFLTPSAPSRREDRYSEFSRFTPSLSSGTIRVKPIVGCHRPKRFEPFQFHHKHKLPQPQSHVVHRIGLGMLGGTPTWDSLRSSSRS